MAQVTAVMLLSSISGFAVPMAVDFPVGGGPHGIDGLRIAPVGGVPAKLTVAQVNGQPVARVSFKKTDGARRMVAVEAVLKSGLGPASSLKLSYLLALSTGKPPLLLAALFERGGAMWFRVLREPAVTGRPAATLIPLTSLRLAAFTKDDTGKLEWENVEKVWVGMVIDGPAEGTLDITDARFTDEQYKASAPLPVMGPDGGQWSLAHDPRAQCTLTTPAEGPEGQRCMKLEFVFPLGTHMYACPSIAIPAGELEGYGGIQFKYKAQLPQGIVGLLVTLGEDDGSGYEAYPYPPPSDNWQTVTIPFNKFRLAGWTQDENGQLDKGQLRSIVIGAHGTATGDGGKGIIWVADLCMVP
ncbi:MAG: hypothetical protein H5T86_11535 [Armatimonadetes bacterium]|nr:hypothetical protein [Armatimonadota bacterium]